MNNDELKKKIVDILLGVEWEGCLGNKYGISGGKSAANAIADALIEAGIGDVSELKKHRILVKPVYIPNDEIFYIVPQTEIDIKQLYNGEEVEQIVKERDQYKHRAEVAERALEKACECIANTFNPYWKRDFFKQSYVKEYKTQAERELSEEGK